MENDLEVVFRDVSLNLAMHVEDRGLLYIELVVGTIRCRECTMEAANTEVKAKGEHERTV